MKEIKLRSFSIENTDITLAESDAYTKLKEKLEKSPTANERRMVLNPNDENKEEDLISYFSQDGIEGSQFCTMLRIAPGGHIQHINDVLLNKNKFTMEELGESDIDVSAIYKDHYYFTISNKFLVTNLPGNITIKRLQTYISWMLGKLYEFTPMLEESKLRSLEDVRHITFQDPGQGGPTSTSAQNATSTSILDLGKAAVQVLRNALTDTKGLSDIELSQMVSAKLVLQFQRPKKGDTEAMKKAYAAMLKPVSDLENVTIRTKDHKTIAQGKDLIRAKTVKIEVLDNKKINEKMLEQEMAKLILELENEKKCGN